MQVFELLKADHEKVADIMRKIEETTERGVKTREELFTQLKSELDLHAQVEEQFFYPALEDADETREITLEAYEEHNLVKQLLTELEAEAKDEEQWTAKFMVLKENVEHHVEEEEGELFKQARPVLGKERSEEIAAQIQEAKRQGKAASAKR